MSAHLLVVEDDPSIRLGLKELLAGAGYTVTLCERGDTAVETAQRTRPHLILLDIMLPGASGYEICGLLRQRGVTVPILMLTAKSQEPDKITGFELGADDYVTKPFGARELLARVQALLRRATAATDSSGIPGATPFRVGVTTVNPKTFELQTATGTEPLTPKELAVLQLLHAHEGQVLSRDRLLTDIWGYHYYGTTRAVDQVVLQLRKKLGADSGNLQTVHGAGYRLR